MRDLNHSTPARWPDNASKDIRCDDEGFLLGAATPLIRRMANGRFAFGTDRSRCLALLSVVGRRPIGADILTPLEAAAAHWASGDKALATLRLVFAGLPRLAEPADVYRLQAAAYCLDEGLAPRDLMKALDLDPSFLDLAKFDPDQPRVPAGHGQESGRWTSEGGDETVDGVAQTSAAASSTQGFETPSTARSRAMPSVVPVAANGPLKPEGSKSSLLLRSILSIHMT